MSDGYTWGQDNAPTCTPRATMRTVLAELAPTTDPGPIPETIPAQDPPGISSCELLIATVLNCVCVELNTKGRPVCSCAIRHAIQWPSMEGCCECDSPGGVGGVHGQAWARFQRIDAVPSSTALADDTSCDQSVQFVFDVGVHRCVPAFGDENGGPVSPATYTADALALINDEAHIRRGILCCPEPGYGSVLTGWRWKVTQSLPLGPLGGCAGVVVTVTATGVQRIGIQ